VQAARLTSGSYSLDVTDPSFTAGAKPSVTIATEWLVDTNCTINVFYHSTSGMKLGKSVTYTGATLPGWKDVNFSVTDARFGVAEDVRIEITGASPGLAYVAIYSSQLPPSATPYETWANTYGGTAVIGSATNDYDRDGASNLLEYALNTAPNSAASVAQPVVGTAGSPAKLTFSFLRARADVTYTVESSTDLVGWNTLATNPGSVGQSVTVTDTVEFSPTTPKRFLRLRVTVP
jgi:hypothetical protein